MSLADCPALDDASQPLLSDWLRACETSELGTPEVSFAPHIGVECMWRRAPHEGHPVIVRVLVLWRAMPRAEVSAVHDLTGHPTATHWRHGPHAYTTPHELHAALDRLAAVHAPSGARSVCSECGEAWDVCLCVPL